MKWKNPAETTRFVRRILQQTNTMGARPVGGCWLKENTIKIAYGSCEQIWSSEFIWSHKAALESRECLRGWFRLLSRDYQKPIREEGYTVSRTCDLGWVNGKVEKGMNYGRLDRVGKLGGGGGVEEAKIRPTDSFNETNCLVDWSR